jgi:hypothetical protein
MVVHVDPDKIRRAIGLAKPTLPTPAEPEATLTTKPMAVTPPVDPSIIARAIEMANPNKRAPAQLSEAIPVTTSTLPTPPASPTKPRRATRGSKPNVLAPAASSEATVHTTPMADSPPTDPVLFTIRQLGRLLDDIELMRIQNGNRIGAGQRAGLDLPWMTTTAAQLDALEHTVELELKRAWRKHRLAKWAKGIPGAGEVLMGRLIAEIGEPADRANPGKLLAYCGHGDPARAGQIPKGATQEELFKRGNPHAKKAVWKLSYQFMRTVGTPTAARLETDSTEPTPPPAPARPATKSMGQSPVRARSPYRDIYDERKAATEGKLHARPCKRCGPAGHPAEAGSPWSDAHRHADALRIVGKRFLIDLWVASRVNGSADNQEGYAPEATH